MRRFFCFSFFSFVPWLLLALGLSPLVVWAWLGSFTRYLADDYSTSSELLKDGFWQAQAFWYQSWSGRYSFTFLISFVELAGVRIVPWLPLTALSAWFLCLFWALKHIFSALDIPAEKKWLGILTAVILFGTVKSLPNYSEVIFWQTGIMTYQASNIFLAFFVALFLVRFFSRPEKPKVAIWEYFASFIIAFVVGGFSETGIVIQVALLTLALLFFVFIDRRRNNILKLLLAAYLGSWCSLVAIVKAPGNLTRSSSLAGLSLQSLVEAFLSSVKDVPVFLAEWIGEKTVLVVMLLLTGVFVGFWASHSAAREKVNHELRQRALVVRGFSLLGVACVLLGAGFFPAYVAWGARPPDRAIFIPMFIFVWAFVLFGFFAGRFLNSYFEVGTIRAWFQGFMLLSLALAMVWMQVRTAFASLQLVPTLQTYVQLWDERDAFLRQASTQGQKDVVIPGLRRNPALHDLQPTIWILGELEEDPHNWKNEAAASYYGLRSISGK